jgi:hypothetical protein
MPCSASYQIVAKPLSSSAAPDHTAILAPALFRCSPQPRIDCVNPLAISVRFRFLKRPRCPRAPLLGDINKKIVGIILFLLQFELMIKPPPAGGAHAIQAIAFHPATGCHAIHVLDRATAPPLPEPLPLHPVRLRRGGKIRRHPLQSFHFESERNIGRKLNLSGRVQSSVAHFEPVDCER